MTQVRASVCALMLRRRLSRPRDGTVGRLAATERGSSPGLSSAIAGCAREADASQVQAPRKQSQRGRRNPQCRCRERRQAAGAASAAWKRDRIMDWHAEGQQDVIAVAAGQFREVSYIALLAACAACRCGRLRRDHGDKQRSGAQGERRVHGLISATNPWATSLRTFVPGGPRRSQRRK